ncbi:MAG: NYN domain-containing protein [Candidatus Nanoarchaeia archaeon]
MIIEQDIALHQSVAILCDGNNIERSVQDITKNPSTMLNFDQVVPKLLNGRGLNRLVYFREGKNISSKLADRLYEKFYGSVVPCHKSADIPLSIKATQLASKVDTIIILSGDSDYVELVTHLKGQGVRVEIAAVVENTAKILTDEADYFHPITQEDCFSYTNSSSNSSGRSTTRSSNRSSTRSSTRLTGRGRKKK